MIGYHLQHVWESTFFEDFINQVNSLPFMLSSSDNTLKNLPHHHAT
jgi:hypothetical protein